MTSFFQSLPATIEALLQTHPDLTLDKDQGLLFGQASLQSIATEYGSPTWVINADILKARYNNLDQAFKAEQLDVSIHYAMKANGHIAILDLLAKEGAGADIVSGGELLRALKAGISPAKICFSGVGKTEDELRLAIETQIAQINVESREELHLLSKIAQSIGKNAAICLRINPDVDAKTHHKITTGLAENKFGIAYKQAIAVYKEAYELPNITPLGFDVHIGSQISSTDPYRQAFIKMVALIKEARNQGLGVSTLDCGGGFGISYHDEKEARPDAIATLMKEVLGPLNLKLGIEPGRWLIGPSGVLISKVVMHKSNGPDAAPFIIIDAAMNDLVRPAMYDSWHGILPISSEIYQRPCQSLNIDGPVCESSDIFARDRLLPNLLPGDYIAILDAGAYGSVMSSTYNARPLAAQIMVSGNQSAVIQPRQSIEDLWKDEIIPSWYPKNS
ncbi:diaminopimelate decarboxylase [Commensalibacter papalotli (ex Botero et al. 2024)]|uniref:Diaminopimelate decarboxylase n=1 Tax=Commensalibacter papalotli (ex Botero et al. 2024) TaxID=2972766 RepID=A0ABM9HJ37_9PROT|nr:diaminopimelate decarboxylase [Commensalibacter papalotli (ex Botero et al. 2024)]CAI3925413.1 Diaminopimelate decarboxylase (LysA) (PDB:1D7K) [Commensalibacter papalotli (ex Botero et al. 2024)]CAI3926656.1 Diaminopimelate decarboxylase (LysA) (PDB:1D7K) [Commensalibacter papalotli (ex Botero et al. 2024)]